MTGILLILITAFVSWKGFKDHSFYERYKFSIERVLVFKEYYRVFTSGFLHVSWPHLIWNMISLYAFSESMELVLGVPQFLLVYFVSLICGSLLTLYFHKYDYSYRAIGASGAVMGVLFSSILINPDVQINFIPGYLFGIIYLLFSIYGQKAKRDNIGHMAHFGGAIGGYAITLTRMPQLLYEQTFTVIALAVPIVILFIMERLGKL